MSIYDVSERERRQRAQARAMERKNAVTTVYGPLKDSRVSYEGSYNYPPSPVEKEEEKNFWASTGDFFGNILKGALKGIEGIYDFGASVVGEVGGWFDDGFKQGLREHVEYDLTGAATDPWLKDLEKQSFLGEDSFLRNVAQGVGGMLPAVITGGATHIGAVGTGMIMAGAAGQGTEEALKSGADYEPALLYGAGSGAVEGLTEKIGGFTFGGTSKLGKAVAGTRLSRGIGKVAFDAVGEGLEEVISDVGIDPGLKFVTGVDRNIGENYKQAIGNAPEIFGTGAAVGSVMQGGQNFIRSHVANKDRGGSHATRADNAVANIVELSNNYNESRDNNFKTDAAIRQNLSTISQELVKMSPEARKNYLESIGATPVKDGKANPSPTTRGFLQGAFNENGTLSEGYFTWFRNAGANAPKNQYYSHGIAGRRDTVQSDMVKITNTLRESYAKDHGVSLEEAVQAIPDVKIYDGELTAKEKKEFSKFKEGFSVLNKVGGEGLNFVMVDSNSEINGTIVDGKTVYMAKDTFTNGTWAKTLVHEYTHFAEGSREYERLVKLLSSNRAFTKTVSESLMEKGYGFDEAKLEAIREKRADGKELTKEEIAYYEVYRTELNAHLSEELLGNEQFIGDIVVKDKSLAAKVLHKIKNLLSSLGTIKDDNAREQHRFLKKAENLYLSAIHRAGYKYVNGAIVEDEEKKGQNADSKEGESIDFARKKGYNKLSFKFQHQNFPPENEVLSEAHRLAVWWATKSDTETGDQTLISVNYRWYLVEKFDDALNNYQVEELISNEDFEFVFKEIKEYGRSGKIKSISGSTDFIDKLNKSGYSLEGRKSGSNGYETQYGRENNPIQRMGEDQIEGRERVAGDGNGDSQSGGEDRQGTDAVKFSRKRSYDPKNGKNDVLEIAEAVRRENEAEILREFEEQYNADVKRTAEILDEIVTEAGKRELPVADREYGKDMAVEQKTAEAERDRLFEEQMQRRVNELMELNKRQKEAAEGFIQAESVSSAPVTYEFEGDDTNAERARMAEAQSKATESDIYGKELEKYKAHVKNRQAEFESIVSGVREAIEVTYEFENSHSNAEMLSEVQKESLDRLKQLASEGAEALKSQAEEHHDSVQALLDSMTLEEAKRLGIKETNPKMLRNMGELAKMESILTVDPIKLEKTGKKPKDMFNEYFQSLGGVIHSKRFGDIELTNSSARSEIRHGITAEKLATIEAIPDVIQKGQVIFDREKEPGVQRTVVCAPIKIGTRSYYMGVMLHKDPNTNRLYLHNVVSIEQKRKAIATSKADRVTNGTLEGSTPTEADLVTTGTPVDNDLSMTIILQNALKVKFAKEKNMSYSSKTKVRELIEGAIATLDLTDEEGKALAFVTKDAEGDVVTAFWKAINSASGGTKRKVISNLADVLLANTVLAEKSKYEALDYLKSVMHKFDLREIQEKIEPSLKRKINARWGFKAVGSEDAALDMRSVITALNKMGLNISYADPVQALIEINNFYDSVREYAELEKGDRLSKRLGEEDYKAKKKELVSELTRIFEENKTENELAGKLTFVIEKSQEENKKHREYRKEYKADEAMLTACLALAYQKGETMKIKDHKYTKAQQPFFDLFKKIQGTIGRLIVRGVPNHSTGKEIASLIDDWYTEDNEILKAHFQHLDEKEYKAFISSWKTELAYFKNPPTPEKELSYNEVRKLTGVIAHLNSIFKNFNKVYRRGKWEDITELGTKQFGVCSSAIEHKSTAEDILVKNNQYWNTPIVNAERWDGHDKNGEFTRHIKDLQHGELMRDYEMMKLSRRLEEIFAKDKKFFKRFISGKEKITVGLKADLRSGEIEIAEIPLYIAAELYLTSRNKDAFITLEKNGYAVQLDGEKKYTFMEPITVEQIDKMYESFPKQLKELIGFIHTWHNTEGRELKYECDILKQGTSNLIDGPYHPWERKHLAGIDSVENLFGNKTLTGHSFNKERMKGATSMFIIRNPLQKFLDHAQELFEYKYIDTTIESFTKIMNANVAEEGERWKSVNNLIETQAFYTPKGKKNPMDYIKQLQMDVKGISRGADEANSIVGAVRGAWAVSVLGGNIKVLATQYSSLLSAFGELDVKSWGKAFVSLISPVFWARKISNTKNGVDNDTFKYSKWADVRRYEQNALKAMTVREKAFGKISEFVMKPVSMIDALITTHEFEGAKLQAEREFGFKIGTEENLIKAGEILDELGLRTQQNHYASTRSAASRSKNEFVRGFVTFKQDSMAAISNLFGAIGECRVLKKKLDNAASPAESEELKKQLRSAQVRRNKHLTAILVMCAYMVLLTRLFNKLYGQDDEDEMTLKDIGHDFVASFNGMMPVVSEVTSFFMDGYELDNSFYSSINNLLEATKGGYNLVSDSIQGKNVTLEDRAKTIRKAFYAVGQLTGVPTRNFYKLTRAGVGIVSDGTGKSIDAWFKEPSESDAKASLREGIENKDTSLMEYGLNQMYNKYELELSDGALKTEMGRLLKLNETKEDEDENNYSPLGFKIPENLEINGEDVELSAEDRKVFKNGLKSAEKSSAAMVKTYNYKKLGDKYKAYAIRKVFEYYDALSRNEVTAGASPRPTLVYYGAEVGIDVLATVMAYKQELNSASDAEKAKRKQSTKELVVEYLKKFNLTPVQKSLVLRALGYSDKENDGLVKAHISRRYNLTKEQKAEFLEIAKIA